MKLKDYLTAAGLSQNEFARRSGVAQARIWCAVHGAGLSTGNAIKVVEASGGSVTFEDLVGRRANGEA